MNQDRNRIFYLAYNVPLDNGYGLPVLWTGMPGRRKSALHAQWAAQMGVPYLHLSPGQKGDGYFGVVPLPIQTPDGQTILSFPVNKDIKAMCDLGRGLILVDEVRSAPQIIRPALLGLLQEREFGDVKLPAGVRIMGASNATNDATNGRPLSAPEANRVCHIAWDGFSANEMREHFAKTSGEPLFTERHEVDYDSPEVAKLLAKQDKVQADILALRAKYRSVAATQVFTFVKRRPAVDKQGKHVGDSMHHMPKSGTEACDGPWCSERSWSNVVEVLWTYRAMRDTKNLDHCPAQEIDDPDLQTLLRGLVGGVSNELLVWLNEQDLPDYASWLGGATKVEFEKGRDDRAYLIFSGAGYFVANLPKTTQAESTYRKEMASAFFREALAAAPTCGFESVMAGVKVVQDTALQSGDNTDLTVKPAVDFLRKYSEMTRKIANSSK